MDRPPPRLVGALLLGAALAACRAPPAQAPPAPQPVPLPPAASQIPPPTPNPNPNLAPLPVTILEAVAVIVGAAEPLRLGESITVDPGATFRVVLRGRFADARLSLLDQSDGMLAGAGGREAAEETTVTFEPAAPLRPSASYRLRIDGAASRELHAADGSLRAPVELQLVAAGPAPEPKQKPRPGKKRP